jgi:hypothetical protein
MELTKKFQVVRDRVAGVAMGYQTGVIITGRGGTGKSFAATEELERLGCDYKLHNTHLTPRAVFDELEENPSSVHVIEDAEEVTRNPVSLGVLRSATWGSRRNQEGRYERLITWRAHGATAEVVFDGGIVLISNRPFGHLPEMQALATRIPSLDIDVTDAEIAALMRNVARRGHHAGETRLEPAECLEVAEFIIAESALSSRPLDMRALILGYADRLQSEDGDAGCGWKDLIRSTLRGRPAVTGDIDPVGSRAARTARELEIAREIAGLARADRLQAWQERAGTSESSLYRRLAELGRRDAQGHGS